MDNVVVIYAGLFSVAVAIALSLEKFVTNTIQRKDWQQIEDDIIFHRFETISKKVLENGGVKDAKTRLGISLLYNVYIKEIRNGEISTEQYEKSLISTRKAVIVCSSLGFILTFILTTSPMNLSSGYGGIMFYVALFALGASVNWLSSTLISLTVSQRRATDIMKNLKDRLALEFYNRTVTQQGEKI